MVRVLIPSFPGDVHALGVKCALEDKGHEATLWHTADYPTLETASISSEDERETSWHVSSPELELSSRDRFDVVWYRRPMLPFLPEEMHPGDRIVAERECEHFARSLWCMIGRDAFWVNALEARRNLWKPLQLQEAAKAGLKTPRTLFSNDPRAIREFVDRHPGGVIYKPFHPAQWRQEEKIAYLFTNTVTAGDLPDDDVLRLCPGIFQPRLAKRHELRVICMGSTVMTARLLSQEVPTAALDWRRGGSTVPVEPASLPADLEAACLGLMRRLGLVFGCLDFIVTETGEPVFLEVNEMGQFLWLEEVNPELRVLDAFSEFLIHGAGDFRWSPGPSSVRYGDYWEPRVRRLAEEALARHVDPGDGFAVSESAA